jgi:hypothetical protein
MAQDARNLLDVLKDELEFLKEAGYRKASKSSWRPQFIFEDSPTCLNIAGNLQGRRCGECALMQLVPLDRSLEKIPCRHILLNEQGETLDSLYRSGTQDEIEEAVAKWLKGKIRELEEKSASSSFRTIKAKGGRTQ